MQDSPFVGCNSTHDNAYVLNISQRRCADPSWRVLKRTCRQRFVLVTHHVSRQVYFTSTGIPVFCGLQTQTGVLVEAVPVIMVLF